MISAVILARCTSSRLPNKHFYKIGDKELINIIIDNLKKNNLISKIYIATGSRKKNILFEGVSKKKKVELFFYENENDVTGRVYALTKKINTKYTLLISGDCCLVDNFFIKRLYKQINFQETDFIKSKKKIIHEGITIFKTSIWKKVKNLSKKNYQKEHPGYIVKEHPDKFKIGKYEPLKYELGKKFRLSVDTQSDIDFFTAHYNFLKKKGIEFNLKNVINSKNFNFLNSHVQQKKAIAKKEPKISIITMASKKIGMGHFSRAKVILREINETITSDVKIYIIGKKFKFRKFIYDDKIDFIPKIKKNIFFRNNKIIFDIPKKNFDLIKDQDLNKKNLIIIDNYRKLKKPKFIIPSFGDYKVKSKNIFSGKNYLILTRDILKERFTSKKSNQNLIFLSGSGKLDYSLLDNLKKKNKKIHLIIGPLVSKSEIENLRKKRVQFSKDPEDIFRRVKISNDIYCKFGLSALEIIALNKKPIILIKDESCSRMKDIKILFKLGLIKLLYKNKVVSRKKKTTVDINLPLKNIIKVVNLK